jgi:hypothetical protein
MSAKTADPTTKRRPHPLYSKARAMNISVLTLIERTLEETNHRVSGPGGAVEKLESSRNAIYTAVRQAGARIENGHIVWDDKPAEN